MKYVLIRHGKTQGNLEGRYIGCLTDEPLCLEGIVELYLRKYPEVDGVFASPLTRCRQTAELLYPSIPIKLADGLRECDFGAFENKNYAELNGSADYQAWIDSGGEMPFPGGESRTAFAQRCVCAFERCVAGVPDGTYAFIVHGGTIMAVMERFARPAGRYYEYQVSNGDGFVLNRDGGYIRLSDLKVVG